MPIDESKTQFTCVYIPADTSKPMEERTVPIAPGDTISAMINYVKDHITTTEQLRKSSLSRQAIQQERSVIGQQLSEQIKKNPQLQHVVLTDDIIDRIYLANAVDSVALLPHCKATNFYGIMLYVDDQGSSKKLPRNVRATTMCFAIGNQLEVLGDCFIAKIVDDNDDDFIRCDLTLKDLEGKDWMMLARGIHSKKIPQTMPYVDVCRGLKITPEPSLLTKDQVKPDQQSPGEGDANNTATATTTPSNPENDEMKTDMVSKEITRAYNNGNKPLRDKTNLCGHGHLNCEGKATMRCSRCKSIYYCTAAHQKSDWKRHKAECVAPPAGAK